MPQAILPFGSEYVTGDRVTVTAKIDLNPYGSIEIGAKGTVVFVDRLTHYTEILMDEYQECLRTWRNHLWLIPPDTDEIKHALERNQEDEECLLQSA